MKTQWNQKEKKKKDIFSNTGGICANIEGRRKHGIVGEVQIFSREKIERAKVVKIKVERSGKQ